HRAPLLPDPFPTRRSSDLADRRYGAVGEHHDPGLLAVRTRPGVPERPLVGCLAALLRDLEEVLHNARPVMAGDHLADPTGEPVTDRKSTRLNSSHVSISYA